MRGLLLACLAVASVHGDDGCPDGYLKDPSGDGCFMSHVFFDSFSGNYYSKSYDEVEEWCNDNGGGLLASIHSDEENLFVYHMHWGKNAVNFGLKCKGATCKWDDGSPVTVNTFLGDGPKDDGATRCYMMKDLYPKPQWEEHGCGKQQEDAWVCRVKAKTFDCNEGESEYKGGCVSVHSTPLDQKSAEAACPCGGHLVSIHGKNKNDIYTRLATEAGINGTIYIGGIYENGQFEWTDGSYYGASKWANGFPNTVFGTCVQMLLATEFGVIGQWTNIDCSTKQAYMCFRDGENYDAPQTPKADAHCPSVQYYSGSGTIYSPNYPLSIPGQQSCEYVMGSKEGTRASVRFLKFDCQSGTTLSLFDGLNSVEPFLVFTTDGPVTNQSYSSTTSVMKMVFTTQGVLSPEVTGWEAEFDGI